MNNAPLGLLFLFLLPFLSVAQAQNDSLLKVWNDPKNEDTTRVQALLSYGESFPKEQSDSTLFYTQKAFDFSKTKKMDKSMWQSKIAMGKAYRRSGDPQKSIQVYKEALNIARQAEDSNLVGLSFYNMGVVYGNSGVMDSAIWSYEQSIIGLETTDNKKALADVYNNLGTMNLIINDLPKATEYLTKAIELYKETDTPNTSPLTNLAIMKTRQGDYLAAIELHMKSREINERVGNKHSLAFTYFNLGLIYHSQGDSNQFYEYISKSLEIREELGYKKGIAICLNALAVYYTELGDHEKALECLDRSLVIAHEIGDKNNEAKALSQKGSIQIKTADKEGAIISLTKAMDLYQSIGDKWGIAETSKLLGRYYNLVGDNKKALPYLKKGLAIVEETDLTLTSAISLELSTTYEKLGNYPLAYESYKKHVVARDSILKEENQRTLIRKEYQYEYEKQAVADSLFFANKEAVQKAKVEQTQKQQQWLLGVLAIVMVFSGLLFNRMRVIRKQKHTIEEKNDELNDLNENLEQKVIDRTQEIVEINESLKKSDERYTYALEASNDGIWDYNVQKDVISFSPAIYTMLGFEPYSFPQTRAGLFALFYSEDKKRENLDINQLFMPELDSDVILNEYRLVGKDEEIVWVKMIGKVVERGANNAPLRIVGTHTNITSEKLKNKEILDTILKTEDSERSRIAKDIHDGLQQTLTVAVLNFQSIKKEIYSLNEKAKSKFDLGWRYLQTSITESRSVAHSLMPSAIVKTGIVDAITVLLNDLDSSNEKTNYRFSHNLEGKTVSNKQIEVIFYRIVQEAMNNVNKYAEASNVDVQLKEYDDIFMLTIEDDGKGFDTSILKGKDAGLGFRSIQNRLNVVEGILEVDSFLGRGTQLLIEVNKRFL